MDTILETSQSIQQLNKFPVHQLRGVGPKLAEMLHKLGIKTVQDLLFHLPTNYQDRTQITPIQNIKPGQYALIQGHIVKTRIQFGRRRSLLCTLQDGTGFILLRFFHFNKTQELQFANSKLMIRCFGEIRGWGFTDLEMVHPEYRFIHETEPVVLEQKLTPIYPATEGLQQTGIRKLMDQALQLLDQGCLEELLPSNILQNFKLSDIRQAILYVHRPPADVAKHQLMAGLHPQQQRLAFEELLAHHLSLQRQRLNWQQHAAPSFNIHTELSEIFIRNLPFQLTQAQLRVIAEASQDMGNTKPMLRLIQGDVGSGKTVVAAMLMVHAIANNFQTVLMAPTELLAEQHFKNLSQWFQKLQIHCVLLTGSTKTAVRRQILSEIASGKAQVVIGTHALFQKEVLYQRLGLVVVDEQHRFGVEQRLELWQKGQQQGLFPHQLIMTATPIPRTLAMTAYADLDYSVIDELPPGRKPIATVLISSQRRNEVVARIDEICKQGRQAYWVCTLIEESEVLQCQAAESTAANLIELLPNLRIALIHGRFKPQEKDAIMHDFRAGNIDLLVATTVIEVGVDVPNANLMVIENPERLGLAQLHQLRGRVGRGTEASYCVLMYQSPLSQQAKIRLSVLKNSNDGFEIAQQDLEIRGPGEVLGRRQAGLMQLRIADLTRDKSLIPQIQQVAVELIRDHPQQAGMVIDRWIGPGQKYASV